MDFLPADLIRKKRFGGEHTRDEIAFLIQQYARDVIPDYQIAAWIMAICLKGMTDQETSWLTQEMRDSGTVLSFENLGITVDKHSTGGIGDKTSLILAPIVAAAGVHVPMIAGRGLGHTGGTLDKLESIRGFSVSLTHTEFRRQIETVGVAIMGQTLDICPADRKLYALRDVTGTVDSMPLICGSIMSKKLAEGIQALVLDVKFGSGAFMKTLNEAEALAGALMRIGQLSGKTVTALLTNMNEPLGRFVGNALEVKECLDILDGHPAPDDGKGFDDTRSLSLELAAQMIFLGKKSPTLTDARAMAKEILESGLARKKFNEICEAQGGDLRAPLPIARRSRVIAATRDGQMDYKDLAQLGNATIWLGAGRRNQIDVIDHAAGIEVHRAQGDSVRKGEPLFTLFAADDARMDSCLPSLHASFDLVPQASPPIPLIAKVLV